MHAPRHTCERCPEWQEVPATIMPDIAIMATSSAEHLVPIDIPVKSTVEWLTSRQKVVSDWSKRLAAIQAKAAECFKALPADVTAKCPGGPDAPLDYLQAVRIRDLLSQTSDRTLFGGLTGPALEWDRIVKAYEKGGIHLGEAALSLVQNSEYELPYLRKQATKLRQVIEDSERRQAEYTRSAATCATAYQEECKKLGITPGHDVKQQLVGLTRQLPEHFQTVIQQLHAQGLADAISYYQRFSSHAHQLPAGHTVLPTLSEVREGRTAAPAAELLAGSVAQPSGPAASQQPAASSQATQQAAGISWDVSAEPVDGADKAAASGISWDVTVDAPADNSGAGVNWDIDLGDAGTAVAGEPDQGGPVEVQWDIGVADTGAGGSGAGAEIDWGIDVSADAAEADAQGAQGGGQQRGSGGLDLTGAAPAVARLCVDGDYRAALGDDLLELRAFLIQRRGELASSSNSLLMSVLPEHLQSVDTGTVAEMLSVAEAALGALRDERLSQLLMLHGSSRYVDRLAGALARKAGQEAKMQSAAKGAVARGNEARAQLVETAKKVAEVVERTRVVKAHVENSLTAMFPGRKIVIMGDINAALATTAA